MAAVFQQNRFIFIFAGIMVFLGLLYFAWKQADTAFLSEKEATGKVVGKEFIDAHTTTSVQNVGGVNRAMQIMVGPKWYLDIDLGGPRARAEVSLSEFNSSADGDGAAIKYKQRRISGNLEVTQYLGKPGD